MDSDNYGQVAATLASAGGRIILTTISFVGLNDTQLQEQIDTTKNFALHLQEVGRLDNTLILSQDLETCQRLDEVALPCFIDRASPTADRLPEQYYQREHTFTKFWHASKLVELNYGVLFIDNDVLALKDPFKVHDASYDVEGLSDWMGHELPTRKQLALSTCGRYKMMVDPNVKGGQFLAEAEGKTDLSLRHVNPCQSTALWFV